MSKTDSSLLTQSAKFRHLASSVYLWAASIHIEELPGVFGNTVKMRLPVCDWIINYKESQERQAFANLHWSKEVFVWVFLIIHIIYKNMFLSIIKWQKYREFGIHFMMRQNELTWNRWTMGILTKSMILHIRIKLKRDIFTFLFW